MPGTQKSIWSRYHSSVTPVALYLHLPTRGKGEKEGYFVPLTRSWALPPTPLISCSVQTYYLTVEKQSLLQCIVGKKRLAAPGYPGWETAACRPFVRQKEAKSQFWSVQTYYLTAETQPILQCIVGKKRLAARWEKAACRPLGKSGLPPVGK